MMNNTGIEMPEMPSPVRQETNISTSEPLMGNYDGQFMKHLIDNQPFLEDVYNKLSGRIKKPGINEFIMVKPKLNEEGIGWILAALSIFTDKLFSTSNYSSEEINRDMEDFELTLVRHLFAHYREFDLDIIADLDMIRVLVAQTVQGCLKKSQNAGFFKGFSQSTQHTEVVSDRPSQQKEGMLSRFRQGINI